MDNPFIIGTRVRLRRDVERYPHFIAPAGAAGVITVSEIPAGSEEILICVKLDETLPGAEDWDNEVQWFEGTGDPMLDIEILTPELQAAIRDRENHSHTLNMVYTTDGRHVCAHCGIEPARTIMVVRFDVTDLSEQERNALAGEVSVQAEESDFVGDDGHGWTGHAGVREPTITFEEVAG